MKPRSLEPVGAYDPYCPRIFGTRRQIDDAKRLREVSAVKIENEVFSRRKQREIEAKERALARIDADGLQALLDARRREERQKARQA